MGTFARSWELTKVSFNAMKQDKELILFPILALIFSLLFIVAMVLPSILALLHFGNGIKQFGILQYVLLFILYLGLSFISTFFSVCVVYTTKKRFEGGNATFGESINFAFSRLHLIIMWSIVSATVGLVLRIIERMAERLGWIGRLFVNITTSILGAVWSIVTIFVVPVMVYQNLGHFDAIKKSAEVLKKTWGESIIRYIGFGLIEFFFLMAGIIVMLPLIILSLNLGMHLIISEILISVLYFFGVILVFSLANSIFNTALYVYSDTGKIPRGYSKEIMANAFKRKGQSYMHAR